MLLAVKGQRLRPSMTLPLAIRKDRDLSALSGLHLLSPFFSFLPLLRWSTFVCPVCDVAFRTDYWPHNVRLGSGHRTCGQCGTAFDDGSREWPELRLTQKVRFLFPPLLVGIAGGFLFAAIASLFIGRRDEHSWLVVFIISALGFLPAVLWSLFRLIWVMHSIHRYHVTLGSAHS